MLSVIIPARNEKYLEQTIRNVLENSEGEIEIIVELDGYLPEPQIVINDDRVIFIHHPISIGQRQCINHAVSIAKGKYIMKLDAHCAVDKGFDVKLAADCEPEWTVVPRMYNLDIETFKPKLHKRTDYMYIGCDEGRLLRAEYYVGNEYRKWHSKTELIDDTMCCMGPGWFMHKDRFLFQGGCDEGHGSWGQQGVEVSCKAWLSGGALKVNKKTWFAHWFRGGSGPGFPYPISGRSVEAARNYSRDLWINNKWDKQVRDFNWLVNKFNPPGWEKGTVVEKEKRVVSQEKIKEMFSIMYHHMIKENNLIKWRGVPMLKMPNDLAIYQRVIHDNRPDFIVETGTKWGGSATFYADMCELNGHGHVISIDIAPIAQPPHKRITYITGSSIDRDVFYKVRDMVKGKTVMVILDSKHTEGHVRWELHRYSRLVTKGQFLVVEDCYDKFMEPWPPYRALEWFLKKTNKFVRSDVAKRYLFSLSMGGWIKRI